MPNAVVDADERLDGEPVADVEMVVDEQGHLQVHRTQRHILINGVRRCRTRAVVISFDLDLTAAAREIDTRFEVERQFVGEQYLVRDADVEPGAAVGGPRSAAGRSRHPSDVHSGPHAEDVLFVGLCRQPRAGSAAGRIG